MENKVVLAIGGSDPSGGAGIQADIHTFRDNGVSGIFAITAVTAQNDEELLSIHPTPADLLTQQLATACKGRKVAAVKIGMIATKSNAQALAWFLRSLAPNHVVIDPVLHSSSGVALIEPDGYTFLRQRLLPLASVITPNLSEASAIAAHSAAQTARLATSCAGPFGPRCRNPIVTERRAPQEQPRHCGRWRGHLGPPAQPPASRHPA